MAVGCGGIAGWASMMAAPFKSVAAKKQRRATLSIPSILALRCWMRCGRRCVPAEDDGQTLFARAGDHDLGVAAERELLGQNNQDKSEGRRSSFHRASLLKRW